MPSSHKSAAEGTEPHGAHHHHAVIWLDHREAKVVRFGADEVEETVLRPHHAPHRLRDDSGDHEGVDPTFCRAIAAALEGTQEVLLVGPSSAKTEFKTFVDKHAPNVAKRILGVETLGRCTDHQLLAEGRRFFLSLDRTRPQQ